MHVKDLLDDLNLRLELTQQWYSTDIGDEFEEPTLVENGEIIKIEAQSADKKKVIVIDVDDGMSVVTVFPDKKVIGVKYLENKDDFEYIGKPSDLYF